jgi:hypothetical protein
MEKKMGVRILISMKWESYLMDEVVLKMEILKIY